jgi:hypothetical protein
MSVRVIRELKQSSTRDTGVVGSTTRKLVEVGVRWPQPARRKPDTVSLSPIIATSFPSDCVQVCVVVCSEEENGVRRVRRKEKRREDGIIGIGR